MQIERTNTNRRVDDLSTVTNTEDVDRGMHNPGIATNIAYTNRRADQPSPGTNIADTVKEEDDSGTGMNSRHKLESRQFKLMYNTTDTNRKANDP